MKRSASFDEDAMSEGSVVKRAKIEDNTPVPSLPTEMWVEIASRLPPLDLLSFRRVSRLHSHIVTDYPDKLNKMDVDIRICRNKEGELSVRTYSRELYINKRKPDRETSLSGSESLSSLLFSLCNVAKPTECTLNHPFVSDVEVFAASPCLTNNQHFSIITNDQDVMNLLPSLLSPYTLAGVDVHLGPGTPPLIACEGPLEAFPTDDLFPSIDPSQLRYFYLSVHGAMDEELHLNIDDAWFTAFRGDWIELPPGATTRITTDAINRTIKRIQKISDDEARREATLHVPFTYYDDDIQEAIDTIMSGIDVGSVVRGIEEDREGEYGMQSASGYYYTIEVIRKLGGRKGEMMFDMISECVAEPWI